MEAVLKQRRALPRPPLCSFSRRAGPNIRPLGSSGNLQAECGYALNCSIGSGGLAQWQAERVTRFRHVFGYPFAKATFKDQLSYIQWELTHPKSPWKDLGPHPQGRQGRSLSSLPVRCPL